MSSKKLCEYLTITIAGIAIVSVVVYFFRRDKPTARRERMIAEFYQPAPHKSLPTKSHTGLPHYALWLVPDEQPELSTVVRKYGGYHIKLMNMQPMNLGSDFNLNKILTTGFPQEINHRFNLMLPNINVHTLHTKSHKALLIISGATTLNLLRKFFQTRDGGSWKSLHLNNTADAAVSQNVDNFNYLTLGSDDPYDQAKPSDFTYQTQWYVQLVKGPNFEWISNQHVLLHVAQGQQG